MSNKVLDVCIAGKGIVACETLNYLLAFKNDLSVCVLPSKGDIGEDSWMPSLVKIAKKNSIRIFSDWRQVSSSENLLFLSLEYDRIIDPIYFKTNRLYNLHFSLLPKYRGVFTTVFQLRNGENYSGITLHEIDAGVDTGPIVYQRKFRIPMSYTSRDLYFRLHKEGSALLRQKLPVILASEKLPSVPQHGDSSYYSRTDLDLKQLQPDFWQSSSNLFNFYRSLIFPEYQLPEAFGSRIIRAQILSETSQSTPGTILRDNTKFLDLCTTDNLLRLYKFQDNV